MMRYGAYIGALECKLSDFHKVAHPDLMNEPSKKKSIDETKTDRNR